MKYQRQPSLFCPQRSMLSRSQPTSQRMKAIQREVMRRQAYMPPIVPNRIDNANRRDDVENKARTYMKVVHSNHRPNKCSALKTRQTPLGDFNLMLPNNLAASDKYPVPLGKSTKFKLDRCNHFSSFVSKQRVNTSRGEDILIRKKSIELLHRRNRRKVEPSCIRNNIERNGDLPVDDGRTEDKFKSKRKEIPETVEAENCRRVKRRNVETENTMQNAIMKDVEQKQCSSLPIDEPIWSGIFKIGAEDYVSLAAHLSTKSCEKVWELSRSLLPLVKVTKVYRLEAWPKSFEASGPTADNIGLYFLPHDTRQNDDLHRLVKEVMEKDMVLRAVVDEAEMLILPSILLPEQHQTFQGKHYLWGLFKRRGDKIPAVGEQHQHGTAGSCTQKEGMGKKHDHASRRGVGKEDGLMGHLPGSNAPTRAESAAMPADDAQMRTSLEVSQGGMFGFVVRRTPRLGQLIHEMEREGAVVFAMRGEMLGEQQRSMAAERSP